MRASSLAKQMTYVDNASKVAFHSQTTPFTKVLCALAVAFLSACASTQPVTPTQPKQEPIKTSSQSLTKTKVSDDSSSVPKKVKPLSTDSVAKKPEAAIKKTKAQPQNSSIASKKITQSTQQSKAPVKAKKAVSKKKAQPIKKQPVVKKVLAPKTTTASQKKTISKPAATPSKTVVKKPSNAPAANIPNKPKSALPTAAPLVPTKQAMIEPKDLPAPTVTLDALPLKIGDWTLDRSKKKPDQCSLSSSTMTLEDGAGGTPVTIIVDRPAVVIKTKSDIDLSYTSSQLMLDGSSFKYDKVSMDTSALIETQYGAVIEALKSARIATVELGFWPSWPQTQTYKTDVPNHGFATAYGVLEQCDKIL